MRARALQPPRSVISTTSGNRLSGNFNAGCDARVSILDINERTKAIVGGWESNWRPLYRKIFDPKVGSIGGRARAYLEAAEEIDSLDLPIWNLVSRRATRRPSRYRPSSPFSGSSCSGPLVSLPPPSPRANSLSCN